MIKNDITNKSYDMKYVLFGDTGVYIISFLILVFACFAYIYPSINATGMIYTYSEKLITLDELKEQNKKLRLELAATASYEFIEDKAIKELGFKYSDPDQIILVIRRDEKKINK